MVDEGRAREIIETALSAAEGDEADVALYAFDRNISRFANSSLRQNMSEAGGHVTLRVVSNKRIGVASTSSLTPQDLRATAALAKTLADQSEPLDDFRSLYAANEPLPQVETYDAATADLPPGEKAAALAAAFRIGEERGARFAGTYTSGSAAIATGNSHGVRRWTRFTLADAMFIALGHGSSGFATEIRRRASELDVAALAREATEKAELLAATEEELAPGEYDVILEPAALAEIFEWMNMITFSGRSYDDGSSFFEKRLGEKVLGENFTLADDALDESFLPFPFDLEGRPKRRVALVDAGVVKTPAVDSWFADRLGLEPTASAVDLGSDDHGMALHLSLAPGTSSREEMIRESERAIWVTRFHYINGLLEPKTALMTGMTRDGTFLIENGTVTRRLANLRWTQEMTEAFANIASLSRERRAIATWWNPIGGTFAPTVKIRKWKFTGVQKRASFE